MTQSLQNRPAVIVLLSCLGLASCTPATRPDSFRNSFLPSAPRTTAIADIAAQPREPEVIEPPTLMALMMGPKDVPNFVKTEPRVPPRPQLDNRIRRAEEAFQLGRKFYLGGDFGRARDAFDTSVEILLTSPETAPDRVVAEKKLEELVDKIHRYDVEGLGAGQVEEQVSYDKSPLREILELTFPIDPNLKDKVKGQVVATRSQLPLEENDEVLRYINYFNSERGKATLMAGLKRSGRYRDMIFRILDEEGVPRELIFLAQAESGFLPRALSYMSAVGMWQFVKWRGNEYGLMQTAYSDDRLDPEKATRAGARHLHDLYNQFGDWHLAMAAYNCGPGCVSSGVRRTGYADFWELRRRNVLPAETANYVPLILAMTIMAKNPKDYGLENVTFDPALEYDTVEMVAPTSLSLISDILDMPLTELRDINPALLATTTPSGFALRVPKGSSQNLTPMLSSIPADKRASWRVHRVLEGETLASVASRYRAAASALTPLNRASSADLKTGDYLIIPAAPVVAAKWKPAAAKTAVAAQKRPAAKHTVAAKAPAAKGKAQSSNSHRPATKRGPAVAQNRTPRK